MNTKERRMAILECLKQSKEPLSASKLATQFQVSRQIIVGDIALLRAAQETIIATPKGYLYDHDTRSSSYILACIHDLEDTQDELNTIVDCGGKIENVIVQHPVYGELIGNLHLSNRLEVQAFIDTCQKHQSKNLSSLSNGIHFHKIVCRDEEQYLQIKKHLKEKGYLYEIS